MQSGPIESQEGIMNDPAAHTRSLRRRFFALIVDFVVISALFTPILYPFANSLNSPLRLTSNLFFISRCAEGEVFTRSGTAIAKGNWDAIVVCNATTNGLFPSRSATFIKQTVSGKAKFTQQLNFQIDSANRLASPIVVDTLIFLFLLVLATAFESSKLGATPGKLLLGLKVTTKDGNQPKLHQALVRNTLKFLLFTVLGVSGIATSIYLPIYIDSNFISDDGSMKLLSEVLDTPQYLLFGVGILIGVANLIIWFSIVIPWRNAGYGLYDRWAGTKVIRISKIK
jgi:uncharacterized RDD family membrane protein YckC